MITQLPVFGFLSLMIHMCAFNFSFKKSSKSPVDPVCVAQGLECCQVVLSSLELPVPSCMVRFSELDFLWEIMAANSDLVVAIVLMEKRDKVHFSLQLSIASHPP